MEDRTSFSNDYCSIHWNNHKITARVRRGWKLEMFGDEYSYGLLQTSQIIKEYPNSSPSYFARVVKDCYGRLWYHVYNSDKYEDRDEETFDFVVNLEQADEFSTKSRSMYWGHEHYFFASEQPDFILHEQTDEHHGDAQEYYKKICELNHKTLS